MKATNTNPNWFFMLGCCAVHATDRDSKSATTKGKNKMKFEHKFTLARIKRME